MGGILRGTSIIFMMAISSLEGKASEITISESLNQLLALAGLVLLVFIVMLSIITGLLWKIFQLKAQQDRFQDKLRAAEDGYCMRETSVNDENENESERLLPAETETHLDLNQRFCMNNTLIENVETLENCKLSTLLKGQMTQLGTSRDIMIRRALDSKHKVHRNMIKLELKILFEKRSSANPRDGFWKDLKNPNILRFIGFTEEDGLLSVISEYPEGGNLLRYIRGFQGRAGFIQSFGDYFGLRAFKNRMTISKFGYNGKANLDNKMNCLTTFDLLSFGYQIAKGMRYLANASLYHRQLSLQNVFLTANKTIRIGNFSLARTGHQNEYYKGVTAWEMPVSHRAPETFDEKRYTDRSDIWSYGVCLHELFSLGKTPYKDETTNEVLKDRDILKLVLGGGRLKMPEYCTLPIYNHMKQCWNSDPFSRPTFSDCISFFEQHFKLYDLQIISQINDKLKEASEHQQSLEDSVERHGDTDNWKRKYKSVPLL
uniref:Protein kinase domain-containing protein n=2 Tax=Caenorhabditis tropicalis TaxID=1561998 RepID=A0A1I7U9Q1_9PELO